MCFATFVWPTSVVPMQARMTCFHVQNKQHKELSKPKDTTTSIKNFVDVVSQVQGQGIHHHVDKT